jgi:quercetin dioxygenase-like cupin family protein
MTAAAELTVIATDPGEGQAYLIGPELVTFKVTGAETEGRDLVIEISTPRGGGPPLHTHPAEESWYVIEGEFEFPTIRDGKRVTNRASAGSVVYVPSNAPHTYHNVGAHRGRLLAVLSPAAEMEGFFKEVGIAVEDVAHLPEPAPFDMEKLIAISEKYHQQILDIPGPPDR